MAEAPGDHQQCATSSAGQHHDTAHRTPQAPNLTAGSALALAFTWRQALAAMRHIGNPGARDVTSALQASARRSQPQACRTMVASSG
jgi:hypothetical protein